MIETLGRGDQITNGMNDDGSESRIWNVEEEGRKSVDGEEDDEGGDETSEGSAYTGLGLDSSTGEGTGSRVSTEEGTDQVGDSDGDELLRGGDGVIVDSAEGLGDSDMLAKIEENGNQLKESHRGTRGSKFLRKRSKTHISKTMIAPGRSFAIAITVSWLTVGTPICLNPLGTLPVILNLGCFL